MTDSSGSQGFWGKYRGTVINNVDPENRARLQVMVPDVLSLIPSSWAECCAPLSGMTGAAAGVFMVPPIGAAVWVEFEQGDPNKPIWTGGAGKALPTCRPWPSRRLRFRRGRISLSKLRCKTWC